MVMTTIAAPIGCRQAASSTPPDASPAPIASRPRPAGPPAPAGEPPAPEPPEPEPEPPEFVGEIAEVTTERLGLSWRKGCPVGARDLRLLTLGYWGYDGEPHTGELIVHRKIADAVVTAFRGLWQAKFPIHRMETMDHFVLPEHLDRRGNFIETHDEPDTLNNTYGFLCRRSVGGHGWSQHSYGTAIDINPVQNPYVRGDLLIPSNGLAPRDAAVTGTLIESSAPVDALLRAGLKWGGHWRALKDFMHFSSNGL